MDRPQHRPDRRKCRPHLKQIRPYSKRFMNYFEDLSLFPSIFWPEWVRQAVNTYGWPIWQSYD